MDLGLDGAQREFELHGDLFVGVLFEETHDDQLSVARRHGLEVAFDLRALLFADDVLFGRGVVGGRCREFVVDGQVLLAPPDEIDEGVPGDGVNPLSEGVGRVVAVDVDIDFDDCLLYTSPSPRD